MNKARVGVWAMTVTLWLGGCPPAGSNDDAGVDRVDAGGLACRSDRECTAVDGVCDRSIGRCVECARATDCDAGEACIRSACEPVTECTSSRQCPGRVCAELLGYCVDCNEDVDCGAAVCRDNVCVERPQPCASSRECSVRGLVCDTTLGACVECVDAADCLDTDRRCDRSDVVLGGRCVPLACAPDSASCVDATTARRCNADGSAWDTTPCVGLERCLDGSCALPPAEITIDPAAQDFGMVLVGTSSSAMSFTVRNMGGATSSPLSVSVSGTGASEWTVSGTTCDGTALVGGASCDVVVRLDATSAGSKTAQLDVVAGAVSASATLTALVVTPGALVIEPGAYDYGDREVGSAEVRASFTVRNTGGASVGPLAVALIGAGDYRVITDGCTGVTLAGGASCVTDVGFSALAVGASTASLEVRSPDGAATASLRGTGWTAARLEIEPASWLFDPLAVGTTSAAVSFSVRNTGSIGTGTPSIVLAGAGASQFAIAANGCVGALAGGASCTVSVRFAPTSAGTVDATLQASAAPGGAATAALTGNGFVPGALSLSPTAYDFGDREVGSAEVRASFTARNTGGTSIGPLSTSLTGASDLRVTSDACAGATLSAGATCVVEVGFAAAAAGPRTGTLTASFSAGSATASLRGTGWTAARLEVDPASQSFGAVRAGMASAPLSFEVRNTGSVSSGTPSVTLTGTGASQFSIVSNGCVAALAGGGTCLVTARFAPSSTGTFDAALQVSATPGGTASGALRGDGVSAYRAEVLADTPLAYFPLDESAGPVVDIVGGLVGTVMGSVAFGRPSLGAGTAVDLGTDGWIETPVATALGTAQFSAEVWLRPAAGSGAFRGAVSLRRGLSCSDTRGWSIAADGSNRWNVFLGTPSACWYETIGGTVTLGSTYHVVDTFDGSTSILYINGVEVSRRSSIDYRPYVGTLRMGYVHGDGDAPQFHFDGSIDELAIYDHVLTPTAVARHYAARAP